jgi:hypothetical protein
MTTTQPTDHLRQSLLDDYHPDHEHRPLAGYAVLSSIFGASLAGGLAAAHRGGRPLPPELSAKDIVLMGIATQKVSRLITKEKASSFVRAPFTRFQERTGFGEVAEEARGEGLRLAIGELLICPYCLAQWIAGGFTIGYVAAPRLTRLLASMWTAHAIADALQLAYSAAEERA